jgi:hypothetical protein
MVKTFPYVSVCQHQFSFLALLVLVLSSAQLFLSGSLGAGSLVPEE